MKSLVDQNLLTAAVTGIRWERIYLYLDIRVAFAEHVDTDRKLDFYAVNELYEAKIHFKAQKMGDNCYCLKTNVTNNGQNRCLPVGTYSIYVCSGKEKLADCVADSVIVPAIDNYSRNFLYGNRRRVYTVTFFIQEGGDTLPFRFHALTSSKNGMEFPRNPSYFRSLHLVANFRKSFLSSRVFLRRTYALFARKAHDPARPAVLFMTEQSDVLKSNLKAVHDRMLERGMEQDYRILVSARAATAGPQSKKSWIGLTKKMAQSDIIFLDDHAPVLDWLQLKPGTKVVQLWHAGAGFKSSGYSRWGHEGCPSPVSCHRQYRYGIAGSRNIAPFFSEVWGINDELVLPTGMPRMDQYLDEKYREEKTKELYQQYPLLKGRKVILFAPTYRGMNQSTAYYPYELIDFDRLYEECGEEYIVLFKMHPWVNNELVIKKKHADRFIDVKKYPDINDLFYITDLLITDYSSNIFEYSLMRKPMLFFAFDKIQYSFSRGFHRDYEESAPGKVCYTFAELMDALAAKDFEAEKVEQYVEHHFDYIDSGAADRVIDWIVKDELPEDLRREIEAQEADMLYMETLNFTPELIGEKVDSRIRMLEREVEKAHSEEE